MHYKTIADYRKDNKQSIRQITLDFRKFLVQAGYIEGNKITYDGSKVKACTSKEKVITLSRLDLRLQNLEKQLDSYLEQLSGNDRVEDLREDLSTLSAELGVDQALLEEISQLKSRIAELESLQTQMKTEKKNRKNGISFSYDEETDSYRCIEGNLLKHKGNTVHCPTSYRIYRADKQQCFTCPLRNKCTTSKYGRAIKIPENQIFKNEYLKRMRSVEMKKLIKERKTLIEHVFGTMKRWMGRAPILLTSQKKVQIEIDLYATAYNINRGKNEPYKKEITRNRCKTK